jgi:Uma2 family endonuclease
MTIMENPSVTTPANWIPGPEQGQWAYKEYAAIAEDGRYEVVDGVLYMSPSPSWDHQSIILEIVVRLHSFVQVMGLGRVCVAPFDVELSYANIVQPDVFIVLNEHLDRITSSRVIGAPDLVIEIASPSTARYDLHEKQNAYARAGVPEYWIVNPKTSTVELLVLKDNAYRSLGLFSGDAVLPSVVLPDFPIQVGQFFAAV